jgi:hypothetical protein
VIITTGRPGGNPAGQDHGRRFRHAQVDLDLYRVRKQAQVGGMINEYRLVA